MVHGLIIVVGTFMFMVVASLRYDDALHTLPDSIIRQRMTIGDVAYNCYRGRCSKSKKDQSGGGMKSHWTAVNFTITNPWLDGFFEIYFLYAKQDADFFLMHWPGT